VRFLRSKRREPAIFGGKSLIDQKMAQLLHNAAPGLFKSHACPRIMARWEHLMQNESSLQVTIGDAIVQAQNVEDKLVLEPVGGILADGSTEGYGLDELDKMVEIFARDNQRELFNDFRNLVEKRRRAAANGG
jgi:hypothetical protein